MARQEWLSGTDTAERWRDLCGKLDSQSGAGPWEEAFAFLERRLKTRYLEPIRVMQTKLQRQGEGFAIVSLHCALIEFLAAFLGGRHYVPGRTDPAWNDYAYKDSSGLFVRFLREQQPFAGWFGTKAEGEDFYFNVRCGLLHEAMTKGQWRINISGPRGIDVARRVVYRDTLQQAIEDWLAAYEGRLMNEPALREAFIRKLNHVAV